MSDPTKYTVRLMTAAKRDLNEAKKSMRLAYGDIQARRMLVRINNDLKFLETSPYGIPKIEAHHLKALGYRGLIIDNSNKIAFYVVCEKKKQVQIRRILSCRQDYIAILKLGHSKRPTVHT